MPNFVENQKINNVRELKNLAARTVELANDLQKAIEKWQAFGLTPTELIASGVLVGTEFDGLPDTVLSNWIGSADNLGNTWYTSHGVNARLMTLE